MRTLKSNLEAIQAEKNNKIIPENIKAGVKIFNVIGTLSGVDNYEEYLSITQKILGEKVKKYTELEYIEATGSQYINTDYVPSSKTMIDMKVSKVTALDAPMISSSSKWQLGSFILTSGGGYYKWYYQGELSIAAISTGDVIDNIVLYRKYVKFNEEIISNDTSINGSMVSDVPLRIFNGEIGGSQGAYSSYRLHEFKIYETEDVNNPEFIKDFIPVIENETGEIGLYDKINDVFYSNQGEGEFIAGPEKKYLFDGLVSHYKLEENTDDNLENNNATNYGLTFEMDSDLNRTVAVAGIGYALFENDMDKQNITLSILAKSSGNTEEYNFLFAFGDTENPAVADNALSLTVCSGKLSLDVSYTTFNTDFDVNDGAWHRYTVTLSEGQYIKIYADEELIYETTHALSVGPNGFIATWNPDLEFFFNGWVADALIYNRALTAEEIKYNCQIDNLVSEV